MVKEDIIGGLNHALSKGMPLKKAMLSFYYAGYPKKEIEEAAREIQRRNNSSNQRIPIDNKNNYINRTPNQNNSINVSKKRISVSEYNDKRVGLEKNFLLIYLGIGGFLFLALIAGLFIFREQIINIIRDLLQK